MHFINYFKINVSTCNSLRILHLNDGVHQCVEQRDDELARIPSFSLQGNKQNIKAHRGHLAVTKIVTFT